MKKILAMLLALAMLFALAACGDKPDDKEVENSDPVVENTGNTENEQKPNGPAVYTYEEDRGDFKVTWELTMYPNGMFYLNETHGLSGSTTEHSGTTWRENDNGTISTGPWSNADVDKSEFFQPTGECTWILNDDGTMEPTEHVAASAPDNRYTYDEDRGDFMINWTVILNEDGTFILEEVHGMSGDVTEFTGKQWTDNGDGTITTGEWDDSSANKSEFFKPNGECTWKVNSDGTCEPVVEEGAGGSSEKTGVNPGKYTYVEDCGDFEITWNLALMGNGNCRVDETHGLSGETVQHTAVGWTDNGDGTVTTGEWEDSSGDKSDFFKPNGEATWKITGDGTCEPVAEGEGGASASSVNPGKYTYVEDRGDFQVTWNLALMGNGNCRVDETHGLSGETTQHTANGWTDNGDGTVTTGEWEDSSGNKSEFFKPNGEATWKINADGTCEPVVEEKEEAPAGSLNPGKYTYEEDHGGFKITFEVLLMGNGNCRIDETHGLSGEVAEHTAAGWTDNGDGTATTGAWEDASVNKSDFFAADGTCTWKINADGTCEPVA